MSEVQSFEEWARNPSYHDSYEDYVRHMKGHAEYERKEREKSLAKRIAKELRRSRP